MIDRHDASLDAEPDGHDAGRRQFIAAALASATLGAISGFASAHGDIGPVIPPQKLPDADVTLDNERRVSLQSILQGKTTALQLIFTGCSTTCPLQGATFASVQDLVPDLSSGRVQLLSLSIDPLGDDPPALRRWLRQLGARPGWQAATLAAPSVATIVEALQQRADAREKHSAQVYLFNAQAQLIWRTEDFPPTREVANLLKHLPRSS